MKHNRKSILIRKESFKFIICILALILLATPLAYADDDLEDGCCCTATGIQNILDRLACEAESGIFAGRIPRDLTRDACNDVCDFNPGDPSESQFGLSCTAFGGTVCHRDNATGTIFGGDDFRIGDLVCSEGCNTGDTDPVVVIPPPVQPPITTPGERFRVYGTITVLDYDVVDPLVTIEARNFENLPTRFTTTIGDTYSFDVIKGNYTFTASVANGDWANRTERIEITQDTQINFTIRADFITISGIVFDPEEQPLSGAFVQGLNSGRFTLSGSDGRYELRMPRRHDITVVLRAHHPQYGFSLTQNVTPIDDVERNINFPSAGCPDGLSLQANHVKGESVVGLNWSYASGCMPESFALFSCESQSCSNPIQLTSGNPSIRQFSHPVDWETTYWYKLVGYYPNGEREKITSITTGDSRCEGVFTTEFCEWDNDAVRIESRGYACNERNEFSQARDLTDGNLVICNTNNNPGTYCGLVDINTQFGRIQKATCLEISECGVSTPNLFGFFNIHQCYAKGNCYVDAESANINTCISCQEVSSCGDYRTKAACQGDASQSIAGDACSVPGTCEWRYIDESLGLGVCVSTDIPACESCSGPQCTPSICDTLSTPDNACIYTNEGCAFCNQLTCYDVGVQASCTNTIDYRTNRMISSPGDSGCTLGACFWNTAIESCVKDFENISADGCSPENLFYFENGVGKFIPVNVCRNDNIIPITQYNNDFVLSFNPHNNPQTLLITGYDTGSREYSGVKEIRYCINATQNGCSDTRNYRSGVFGPEFSLLLDSQAIERYGLQPGYNTINFFAIDRANNWGHVNSVTFLFDTQISDLNIEVDVRQISYDTSEIVVSIQSPKELACSIQVDTVPSSVPDSFRRDYLSIIGVEGDGEYIVHIYCKDRNGNEIRETRNVSIQNDIRLINIKPSSGIYDTSTIRFSADAISQITYCELRNLNINEPASPMVTNGNVNYHGYVTFILEKTLQSGPHNYQIYCDSGNADAPAVSSVSFVIDTIKPTVQFLDRGEPVDFSQNRKLSGNPYEVVCTDLPPGGFGCERVEYCLTALSSCEPTQIVQNNRLQFTQGGTFCYRAREREVNGLGGGASQTICYQNLDVDEFGAGVFVSSAIQTSPNQALASVRGFAYDVVGVAINNENQIAFNKTHQMLREFVIHATNNSQIAFGNVQIRASTSETAVTIGSNQRIFASQGELFVRVQNGQMQVWRGNSKHTFTFNPSSPLEVRVLQSPNGTVYLGRISPVTVTARADGLIEGEDIANPEFSIPIFLGSLTETKRVLVIPRDEFDKTEFERSVLLKVDLDEPQIQSLAFDPNDFRAFTLNVIDDSPIVKTIFKIEEQEFEYTQQYESQLRDRLNGLLLKGTWDVTVIVENSVGLRSTRTFTNILTVPNEVSFEYDSQIFTNQDAPVIELRGSVPSGCEATYNTQRRQFSNNRVTLSDLSAQEGQEITTFVTVSCPGEQQVLIQVTIDKRPPLVGVSVNNPGFKLLDFTHDTKRYQVANQLVPTFIAQASEPVTCTYSVGSVTNVPFTTQSVARRTLETSLNNQVQFNTQTTIPATIRCQDRAGNVARLQNIIFNVTPHAAFEVYSSPEKYVNTASPRLEFRTLTPESACTLRIDGVTRTLNSQNQNHLHFINLNAFTSVEGTYQYILNCGLGKLHSGIITWDRTLPHVTIDSVEPIHDGELTVLISGFVSEPVTMYVRDPQIRLIELLSAGQFSISIPAYETKQLVLEFVDNSGNSVIERVTTTVINVPNSFSITSLWKKESRFPRFDISSLVNMSVQFENNTVETVTTSPFVARLNSYPQRLWFFNGEYNVDAIAYHHPYAEIIVSSNVGLAEQYIQVSGTLNLDSPIVDAYIQVGDRRNEITIEGLDFSGEIAVPFDGNHLVRIVLISELGIETFVEHPVKQRYIGPFISQMNINGRIGRVSYSPSPQILVSFSEPVRVDNVLLNGIAQDKSSQFYVDEFGLQFDSLPLGIHTLKYIIFTDNQRYELETLFRVERGNLQVYIKDPFFGKVNHTYVQNLIGSISLETDRSATCYMDTKSPENELVRINSRTHDYRPPQNMVPDQTIEQKIICTDGLDDVEKVFKITLLPGKPEIRYDIEHVFEDKITQNVPYIKIDVQTTVLSHCAYSINRNIPFSLKTPMTPFSTVQTDGMSSGNIPIINGNYTFRIQCRSAAGVLSDIITRSIIVDKETPLRIGLVSPTSRFMNESQQVLNFSTNKIADCFLNQTALTTQNRRYFSYNAILTEGDNLFTVRCVTPSEEEITTFNLIYDTTPPVLNWMNVSGFGRLRVDVNFTDNISGIARYEYVLGIAPFPQEGWNETFNETSYERNYSRFLGDVLEETDYFWTVRASNRAGLVSQWNTSEAVQLSDYLGPRPVEVVNYCIDGVFSGNETDVDCGGPNCPGCDVGQFCLENRDCQSLVCAQKNQTTTLKVCQAPTCSDKVMNQGETDVDCGGPNCEPCELQKRCQSNSDCLSGVCAVGEFGFRMCVAQSCTDKILNGNETDVDCGGPECNPCADGKKCNINSDCASGSCTAGICDDFETLDSDGDGMPDFWEIEHRLDPHDPSDALIDSDADGLTNIQEYEYIQPLSGVWKPLDPRNPDSDGDGFTDGVEVRRGTNAWDPKDYPSGFLMSLLLLFMAIILLGGSGAGYYYMQQQQKQQSSSSLSSGFASSQSGSAENGSLSQMGAPKPKLSTRDKLKYALQDKLRNAKKTNTPVFDSFSDSKNKSTSLTGTKSSLNKLKKIETGESDSAFEKLKSESSSVTSLPKAEKGSFEKLKEESNDNKDEKKIVKKKSTNLDKLRDIE